MGGADGVRGGVCEVMGGAYWVGGGADEGDGRDRGGWGGTEVDGAGQRSEGRGRGGVEPTNEHYFLNPLKIP